MKENVKELMDFLDSSPTSYHAVDNMRRALLQEGFTDRKSVV